MSIHNKEAAEREAFEKWREDNDGHLDTYNYPDDAMFAAYMAGRRSSLTASEMPATEQAGLPEPDYRCGEYAGPAGEGISENLYTAETIHERDAMWMAKIAALRSEQSNLSDSAVSTKAELVDSEQAPAGEVPSEFYAPGELGKIDANRLEEIAKERPNECFLKGSGVLKLIGGIRQLEGELRSMRAAFHANMLRAFPGKSHEEISAEIDRAALSAPPAVPSDWNLVLPGGKRTDEWESARVADYNKGWNDYRKAATAALAALSTPPAVPADTQIAELAVEAGLPYGPDNWNALRNFARSVTLLSAAPAAPQGEQPVQMGTWGEAIEAAAKAAESLMFDSWCMRDRAVHNDACEAVAELIRTLPLPTTGLRSGEQS